jgi:carbamoyl-phosphate synthase large subunit
VAVISVVVTGVGGGGLGEQVVKALTLPGVGPYDVAVCDVTWESVGLLDAPGAAYTIPMANDPAYLATVQAVCAAVGAEFLIPGSEPEIKRLSQDDARHALARVGVTVLIQPATVLDVCFNKAETMARIEGLREVAEGSSLPPLPRVPKTRRISSIGALDYALDYLRFVFPLIIKPSVGGGGSNGVFLAQTYAEALPYVRLLLAIPVPVIVQEYVGTPEEEYTVGVLTDHHTGDLLGSAVMHRHLGSALSARTRLPNRTGRDELGPVLTVSTGISQGTFGAFPTVARACEALALSLGSRGPLNVQCRVHRGEVYVFEINPRFSGTTSSRAMLGFNEPDVLIRRRLGEDARPALRPGIVLRGLVEVAHEGPHPDRISGAPTP